jgi:hypothetical protein
MALKDIHGRAIEPPVYDFGLLTEAEAASLAVGIVPERVQQIAGELYFWSLEDAGRSSRDAEIPVKDVPTVRGKDRDKQNRRQGR